MIQIMRALQLPRLVTVPGVALVRRQSAVQGISGAPLSVQMVQDVARLLESSFQAPADKCWAVAAKLSETWPGSALFTDSMKEILASKDFDSHVDSILEKSYQSKKFREAVGKEVEDKLHSVKLEIRVYFAILGVTLAAQSPFGASILSKFSLAK
jgi:hypothetical protein